MSQDQHKSSNEGNQQAREALNKSTISKVGIEKEETEKIKKKKNKQAGVLAIGKESETVAKIVKPARIVFNAFSNCKLFHSFVLQTHNTM